MAYTQSQLCRMLKAISEPKRLQIVCMLAGGRMSATEILKQFHVTQPTLSHDMRLLTDTELVQQQRIGKTVYYWMNREKVQELGGLLMRIGLSETIYYPAEDMGNNGDEDGEQETEASS